MKSISSQSADELGKTPLSKLIIRYSGPAILALIVNALYNFVDRLFLAHFVPSVPEGSDATLAEVTQAVMSGLGFAMPYMEFIAAFGVLLGAGSAALLSIRLGAKDQEGAEKIAGQCIALNLLFYVTISILAFFLMAPVLRFCGAGGYALDFACSYLTIIIVGSLFMNLSFGFGALIRAEGKATMAMLTMVVGAVSNVILDPIFIFGCGIVPAMGINGAAWATNLSMVISTLFALFYMVGSHSPVRLRLNRLSIYRRYIIPVLSIGMIPAILQIISSFVHAIFIRGYKVWGGADTDMLITAVVIIQGVHSIVLKPGIGIGQAAQPIIGYSYGAGKYARMMKCTFKATWYSTLMSLLFFIVLMIWAGPITRAFIPDVPSEAEVAAYVARQADPPAVAADGAAEAGQAVLEEDKTEAGNPLAKRRLYDKTVWGMRILALGFPLFAIPLVLSTYYQSIGHVKEAFILSIARYFLILIPLIILLPYLFKSMGATPVDGVWYAQPINDFIAAAVCAYLLWRERRKVRAKMVGTWHSHTYDTTANMAGLK